MEDAVENAFILTWFPALEKIFASRKLRVCRGVWTLREKNLTNRDQGEA
jgi:hypothetical protein